MTLQELKELKDRAIELAKNAADYQDGDLVVAVSLYREASTAAADLTNALGDDPEALEWRTYAEQTKEWVRLQDQEAAETPTASLVPYSKPNPDVNYINGAGSYETPDDESWQNDLLRNKDGDILSLPCNALVMIRNHPDTKRTVRWNDFTKQVEIFDGPLCVGDEIDEIATAAEDWCQMVHGFTVGHADMKRRLTAIAKENSYNPLQDYLKKQIWDRIPRIDDFLIKYLGAKTTDAAGSIDISEHIRRISRRWFISAAARALDPGCQVDTVLVLEGEQGLRKTSTFRLLGGPFACETELVIGGNKDSKQLAASRWIIELAELDSIRGRNTTTVNAFVTQRSDFYRPPYGAKHVESPRLCVLVGTTDKEEWIPDAAGYRRWWPAYVTKIDIRAIETNRDQLWAEATAMFLEGGRERCDVCKASFLAGREVRCKGHRWWLDPIEQKESNGHTAERHEASPWESTILNWWINLSSQRAALRTVDPEKFTLGDVAECALEIPKERWPSHQKKIGILVKKLGFERFQVRIETNRSWFYRPNDDLRKIRDGRPAKSSGNNATITPIR